MRVINGLEGTAERGSTVLTARRRSLGAVGAEVFDSQRAGGYSPVDFPLFGGLCWAFLETERDRGGAVCMSEPRSRLNGVATDQMRSAKFRETPGGATRAGTMTIGK